MSKEEEIEYYDNLINTIERKFIENYNTSKLENGMDEYFTTKKMIITLTTLENQKNNINNNMTKLDLGECETLLRKEYNIANSEKLYMKKIDIAQEGMKIPKIEYDIYYKSSGTNLIKLNLTVCEKSKISILIPISITDNLDKLNSSSGYFNDICYTATSEDGTDISLIDRQKDFVDNNKMICQEDCDFSEYNYITSTAKCTCKVKESSQSFKEMNINKERFFENFINTKNIANFNFLVCYKKLFNKEGILNNIGCYIILVIIFFHLIVIFIFNIKFFPLIKKNIEYIALKFQRVARDRLAVEPRKKIYINKIKKKDQSEKHEFKINEIIVNVILLPNF